MKNKSLIWNILTPFIAYLLFSIFFWDINWFISLGLKETVQRSCIFLIYLCIIALLITVPKLK